MKRVAIILTMASVSIGMLGQSQAPPPSPVSGTLQQDSPTPTYESSNRPLSGVQNQDIGESSESRNTFVPNLTFAQGWDSNAPRVTGGNAEQSSGISTISGGFRLNRETNKNATSLGYTGGGQIYTVDSDLNSQFHRFDFSQTVVAGRWTFLVADGLSYQKDAFAGFPSLLFPGLPNGSGGTDFQPGITPGESIIGIAVGRLNNTASGQVTYGFSRATTLTSNFSYGLLHAFDDSGFLNNTQWQTGMGLDHKFGRDTLGVNYSFTRFGYDVFNQSFDSHTVQLAYSHILTGRWSFEVSGGPAFVVSNFGGFEITKVYGSGKVGFRYHMPKGDLGLQYSRSVTNGSGALPGAITDDVGVTLGRKLSRSLSANLSGGYARNSGTFVNSMFNTFNVGAGVTHTLGRYASVSMGYTGQRQTGSSYAGLTRHSAVVTFNWSFRPIVLH